MFWFDIMNGQSSIRGGGYIPMVRIGEPLSKSRHRDNEILIDPMNCEIMEYIGINDKNWVEIYEGFTVNAKMFYDGTLLPIYGVIEYCYGYAGYSIRNESGQTLLHHIDISSIEVTGNIYQNPELLVNKI